MAHYSSAACWKIIQTCTKDHEHTFACSKSVMVCDGDHIKKGK